MGVSCSLHNVCSQVAAEHLAYTAVFECAIELQMLVNARHRSTCEHCSDKQYMCHSIYHSMMRPVVGRSNLPA
jgi:hypothetical protein